MTGGPDWDPFDGVPAEQVFARRYLKGVALRVLLQVVGALSLVVAGSALLTRDPSLLLVVPIGWVALLAPVLLVLSDSALSSPMGRERDYRAADLGGLRRRLQQGRAEASDRPAALALRDAASAVRRGVPRVGALGAGLITVVALWFLLPGRRLDPAGHLAGLAADAVALVTLLAALLVVSGRVEREVASGLPVLDGVRGDAGDASDG